MQVVVVDVTVRLEVRPGHRVLQRLRIVERTADIAAHLEAGAAVVPQGHLAGELITRLLGADDDGPADGVAPVKRALRPLQHFDVFDIEELLVEGGRVRHRHPIDQHGHRGLAVASLRDAADRDERGPLILGLDHRHVGRELDEILRTLDAGGLDLRRAERVHRDRHVMERLVPLAGGDDDFLQRILRLRPCWQRCQNRHADRRGNQGPDRSRCHVYTPYRVEITRCTPEKI